MNTIHQLLTYPLQNELSKSDFDFTVGIPIGTICKRMTHASIDLQIYRVRGVVGTTIDNLTML